MNFIGKQTGYIDVSISSNSTNLLHDQLFIGTYGLRVCL